MSAATAVTATPCALADRRRRRLERLGAAGVDDQVDPLGGQRLGAAAPEPLRRGADDRPSCP